VGACRLGPKRWRKCEAIIIVPVSLEILRDPGTISGTVAGANALETFMQSA
jgi:hypothetical protein